jgi:transposase
MLSEYCSGRQVYLVTGYTDMRKAMDGLAAIVEGVLGQNPCSESLYLFCGRRRDRLKALVWEKDGYVLLYKRLNNGVFQWPRNETQARKLTAQQVRWLLEGLSIEQPKAIRAGVRGALY